MRKNKFIKFLLCIVMFLGFVNVNSFVSTNDVHSVAAANITKNPSTTCIFIYDNVEYIHSGHPDITYILEIDGATYKKTISPSSPKFYLIETPFSSRDNIDAKIQITFTASRDGKPRTTRNDTIKLGRNKDPILSIYLGLQDVPGHFLPQVVYTLTPFASDSVNRSNVYFGWKARKDDTIYVKYNSGNQFFKYKMIATGDTYKAPNSGMIMNVFRAPIFTSILDNIPGFDISVSYLGFEVVNYKGEAPDEFVPITTTTPTEYWKDHIYFMDNEIGTWKPYNLGGYSVTFYPNAPIDLNSIEEQATDETNYTVTIPTPDDHSGYTFVGWYADQEYTKPLDIHSGETIFISQSNIEFYGRWVKGIAHLIYVDANRVKQNKNLTENIDRIEIIYGNKQKSRRVDQFSFGSTIFFHIIEFKGGLSSVNKFTFKFFNGQNELLTETYEYAPGIKKITPKGAKYHLVVPNPNHPEDNEAVIHIDKLYSITYRHGYNDNRAFTYFRYPYSINTIYPLFFELDNYTLEHWYEDEELKIPFEHQVLTKDITLYSNYINNYDYYIYIDNYQNRAWSPNILIASNNYFLDHEKKYIVGQEYFKDLGHNVYRFEVDISLSFDQFYLSGIGLSGDNKDKECKTETKKLETEYTYFDITKDPDKDGNNIINTEKYEKTLSGAQKLPFDEANEKNSFRFSIGVPKEIKDYYPFTDDPVKTPIEKASNLGFKVIFIRKDGTSYIGFWNFNPLYRTEAIHLDKLYVNDTLDPASPYAGFYSLTIRDDVAFHYKDFEHIILIAVYKNTDNKLNIIKATEYSIVNRDKGMVDLFYQTNHVIKPEGNQA